MMEHAVDRSTMFITRNASVLIVDIEWRLLCVGDRGRDAELENGRHGCCTLLFTCAGILFLALALEIKLLVDVITDVGLGCNVRCYGV